MDYTLACDNIENKEIEQINLTPKEYEKILNIQADILQKLALNNDYDDTLQHLCLLAEDILDNSVASIMLINPKTGLMNVICAPSIPEAGKKALENLKPGPGGGSCGNAIFHEKPQYVLNAFTDERWKDLRKVAFDYNLCSCWSMPIRDENNKIIGTFALSSFEHRLPSSFHQKLLATAASIVSVVLKNKEVEHQMNNLIYFDQLTKLYNKTYLDVLLQENKSCTLLLLDINNFSYINTTYGFEIGDAILKEVATIFKKNLIFNTVCRVSSDEFAIIFQNEVEIKQSVQEIKDYFCTHTLTIDGITLNVSFTFGSASGKDDLYKNAVIALKEAKLKGKNSLVIFDKEEDLALLKKRKAFIEANNLLHHALQHDMLIPYFQGIRNNQTGEIQKFEVLARIQSDDKIITPYFFLEAAHHSGLLIEITKIIIDKSFAIMQKNNYTFSINLTEDDLAHHYIVEYLQEKAQHYGIKPQRVILEILEGISAAGKKNHVKQLSELKSLGYAIAIDDFGTEYSNFERVLDLEIDFLKIDARYIKDIDTNKKSREITQAIVYFAKNANIPCIAEFVHNEAVQEVVTRLGIDFSQGYLYSEPAPFPQG